MGIKYYKPTSSGRRFVQGLSFEELTAVRPERSLLAPLKKHGGRNNMGRITVRFRGGGHKQMYRIIDFKRDKYDIPGTVVSIEYDPIRTTFIALLKYADGERRYILAPNDLRVNDKVMSSRTSEIDILRGYAMPLKFIPAGTMIHNIELKPGQGGKIVRSAGTVSQLMAKEGDYGHVKLPSGEIRLIRLDCMATIGQLSNIDNINISVGKAGRVRWMGRKPHNRGVSMNPVDHPHGGGEGKAGQGNPHPVSPTGVPAKGFKTRRPKYSDKFIVKDRRQK
ncbi:MAG: 50S ribosomal protein L2 [Deltaproteobacteria bacterium]|nr:50S ribosomal protein L2 [Deltaproteobacteria bacterium]MCL5276890.1 50S ribosomal protein L2 [Deltaproteobacteria bacterium]